MARYIVKARITIDKTVSISVTARTKGQARELANPEILELIEDDYTGVPDEEVRGYRITEVIDKDLPPEDATLFDDE